MDNEKWTGKYLKNSDLFACFYGIALAFLLAASIFGVSTGGENWWGSLGRLAQPDRQHATDYFESKTNTKK
jgi:hypothetical protein